MTHEIVVIEHDDTASKFELLDEALRKTRFDEQIESVFRRAGKSKGDFLVVIKPNLAMFFKEPVTVTDPELVEHLIDRLHDLGYTQVVIGEAQNTFDKWLENREIPNIAKAIGYTFITPKGRKYEIFDLGQDTLPCDFPPECSLYGMPISKLWQEADFRINFAKNKTHEEYFYTLLLNQKNNLIREEMVTKGTLTSSVVHPREVMKGAIQASAAAFIAVHNHPSGAVEPSAEDLELTRRLREAATVVGIRMLDHVIVGYDTYASLFEQYPEFRA